MSSPQVEIGMVVRNGERHIAAAIESFLGQTWTDFVLVVHDNASTDGTRAIVERYAARDPRIRLRTNARDIGVVRNLVQAAAHARAEFFAWAACDDVRHPRYLEALVDALQRSPNAGLACCDVVNIDPDGSIGSRRRETDSLIDTDGMSPAQRVRMCLADLPGTPFYGLFRTRLLRVSLDTLRRYATQGTSGAPLLGLDLLFLARFIREHGLTRVPEPLLMFRRGGISHNLGRYVSLRAYLQQVMRFRQELITATRDVRWRMIDRWRVAHARRAAIARFLSSREMRAMTAHYLTHVIPGLPSALAHVQCMLDEPMRRLAQRFAASPGPVRVVIFGAGKHTRRRLPAIRHAIGRRGEIVGVCDDRADTCSPIEGLRLLLPWSLDEARPGVLLVSSDTYESSMARRAAEIAPPGVRVWCLYDPTLESAANRTASLNDESEAPSTSAMNDSSSASPSMVAG